MIISMSEIREINRCSHDSFEEVFYELRPIRGGSLSNHVEACKEFLGLK